MESLSFDAINSHKLNLVEVYISGEKVFHITLSSDTVDLMQIVAKEELKRKHPREYAELERNPNAKINVREDYREFMSFIDLLRSLIQLFQDDSLPKGRVFDMKHEVCQRVSCALSMAYFFATYTMARSHIEVRVVDKVKVYKCANCDLILDGNDYKNDGKRMMKCGGCKVNKVFYCSKECQAASWKAGHKRACESKANK